jgi:hypothetical protein
MWCNLQVDAEYVARMEDVLHLCAEEPDPKHPVACLASTDFPAMMALDDCSVLS